MRVAIGADHAGYSLKAALVSLMQSRGDDVVDVGAHSYDPEDDFPDFAKLVADSVSSNQADRGVIVCGSGVGASVAANKVIGIRAAICHDSYSAHQGVEHDDLNILCLGTRIIGEEVAIELVTSFLNARFIDEGKYRRRLDKVIGIENSLKNAHS
ncbi:MAG: ribose 5-phosphate isomerase B [SAR202 cluster bacterium]|nr:ribose 5-phosphate isomerase B [SAR202 cluster bacterium]